MIVYADRLVCYDCIIFENQEISRAIRMQQFFPQLHVIPCNANTFVIYGVNMSMLSGTIRAIQSDEKPRTSKYAFTRILGLFLFFFPSRN